MTLGDRSLLCCFTVCYKVLLHTSNYVCYCVVIVYYMETFNNKSEPSVSFLDQADFAPLEAHEVIELLVEPQTHVLHVQLQWCGIS